MEEWRIENVRIGNVCPGRIGVGYTSLAEAG